MSSLEEGMAHGEVQLARLRVEVGWVTGDEFGDLPEVDRNELMWNYIAILEGAVVGTHAAVHTIGRELLPRR